MIEREVRTKGTESMAPTIEVVNQRAVRATAPNRIIEEGSLGSYWKVGNLCVNNRKETSHVDKATSYNQQYEKAKW